LIITVTGKLGSGKTYWVVNYLIEKYYVWKEDIFQFVPKGYLRVVTNIDSLNIDHVDLKYEIERLGLNGVFNKSYVEVGSNTIFIIDEAQNIFHRKFYDKDVFYFFQMSRHYGVDVLLVTQDIDSMCKEIKILQEYEIRAENRSRRTKNMFVYKYLSGDEIFKRQLLRFDMKKAMLYKSFNLKESEKVPNVWIRYVVYACVLLLLSVGAVKFLSAGLFGGAKKMSSKKGSMFLDPEEVEKERLRDGRGKILVDQKSIVSGPGLHNKLRREEVMPVVEDSGKIVRIDSNSESFSSSLDGGIREKTVVEFKPLSREALASGLEKSLTCSNNHCTIETN